MAISFIFVTTIKGVFPLFTLSLCGALLTILQYLNKRVNDRISTVLANIVFPTACFVFISSSVELSEFEYIWPLLIYPIIIIPLFLLLGHICGFLVKFPDGTRNTFSASIAMPNFGLGFMLIKGMCSPYGPLKGNQYCDQGFSYVSIFTLPAILLYWTLCYSVAELDKKALKSRNSQDIHEELNELAVVKPEGMCRSMLKKFMMPSPLFCLIGMVFALIPGFKYVFFNKQFAIYALADLLFNFGTICVVLPQILLGSNLYLMKGLKILLSKKQIIFAVVVKNIVAPAISLVIIYLSWELGVFEDDIVMAYVMFMGFSTPPSVLVMFFCLLLDLAINEAMQILFWSYICGIFTLVLWTFAFLLVIEYS